MKELKRLSTGFLSAVMILSFILMPIPQTNRAWAGGVDDSMNSLSSSVGGTSTSVECDQHTAEYPGESLKDYNEDKRKKDQISQGEWQKKRDAYDKYTAAGGLYKAGCEMTDAMSKASLQRSDQYSDSQFKSIIEQYIVGLFGLVLINGLRWNYLYKYKPSVYGMDCPYNEGAKISMPLAALSALAYVIGDAQANVKFNKASKEATDNAFAAKSRNYIPDAKSDEVAKAQKEGEQDPRIKAILDNKAQEDSYDALIAILESQLKAVKTKKNLARVASIGYYGAEAGEIANSFVCKGKCKESQIEEKKNLSTFTTSIGTAHGLAGEAITALTASAAAGDVGTENALIGCTSLEAQLAALDAKFAVTEGKKEVNATTEEVEEETKSKFRDTFLGQIFVNLGQWLTPKSKVDVKKELAKKTKNLLTQAEDESAESVKMGKTIAAATGQATGDAAIMIAINTAARQCTTYAPVCVGTPPQIAICDALGAVSSVAVQSAKLKGSDMAVGDYASWAYKKTMCCGGASLSKEAQTAVEKTLRGANTDNTYFKVVNAKVTTLDRKQCYINPKGAAVAGCGTYVYQGVPKKSLIFKKKDIIVLDLFDKNAMFRDQNTIDQLYAKKDYSKIILRSGFEQLLLSSYTNKQMQDPKLYMEIVSRNGKILDDLMEYYDQEVAQDINDLLAADRVGYTQRMKKFVKKVVSELFIPKAHAEMGGMVVGGLLSTAGSKVKNPWLKEIFNLGGKLMMLNGVLGGIAKEHALVSPKGRALTWSLISVTNEFVIRFLKQTIKKIEKNIQVVKTEKIKYMKSAVSRGGLGQKVKVGDGALNLQKYNPSSSRTNRMNVKACAVPKGNGFAPAMCPSVIPRQRVSLPEFSSKQKNHLTPDFLKGLSLMSDYTYAAATGSLQGDSMSDSQMATLDSYAKAMANHNATLRDKVDKNDAKSKTKSGVKSTPLKRILANFKKNLGSGTSGGGGSLAGGAASSSPYRGKKEVTNVTNNGVPKKKGTRGRGGGSIGASKAPSFDLDFGDDDSGDVVNTDDSSKTTQAKKTEKLDDFIIQHDDINKRKEIPIWKILSNRYILSYPKVLDEEDARAEPEKLKTKKK